MWFEPFNEYIPPGPGRQLRIRNHSRGIQSSWPRARAAGSPKNPDCLRRFPVVASRSCCEQALSRHPGGVVQRSQVVGEPVRRSPVQPGAGAHGEPVRTRACEQGDVLPGGQGKPAHPQVRSRMHAEVRAMSVPMSLPGPVMFGESVPRTRGEPDGPRRLRPWSRAPR